MSKKIIIKDVYTAKSRIAILDSTINVFIQSKLEQDEIHIMFDDSSNKEAVTKDNCKFFFPLRFRDQNGQRITDITLFDLAKELEWDIKYEMMDQITDDLTLILCEAIESPEECFKIDMVAMEDNWFIYYKNLVEKNKPSVSKEVLQEKK